MEDQVCVECKRSQSAPGDEIVFCDSCHAPYHRLCHNPTVDKIVVQVPQVQWFCHDCQGSKQVEEQPLETGLAGNKLDAETRQSYLSSLPKQQLVQLLLYAETLHPELPIFSPHTTQIVERLNQENDDLKALHQKTKPGGNEDLMVSVVSSAGKKGMALADIWVESQNRKLTLDAKFKHAATRALQRCLRKGKLLETHGRYLPNPDYQPSDEILDQLIRGDDNVMFDYMPLRVPVRLGGAVNEPEVEKSGSEAFSHKMYVY